MKTLKVLFILLLGAIGLLINAFTFGALWNWFVASLFGLEPLKLAHALGLMILLAFLTIKMPKDEETLDWDELLDGTSNHVVFIGLKACVILTLGAIIHKCI